MLDQRIGKYTRPDTSWQSRVYLIHGYLIDHDFKSLNASSENIHLVTEQNLYQHIAWNYRSSKKKS